MLTDKKYTNEHPKYTMFDKYKADKESLTKIIKLIYLEWILMLLR